MHSMPDDDRQPALQNLEWSIVSVYKDHPDLTDYQVDSALEALGRTYARERNGGPAVLPKGELAHAVYDSLKTTCEWLLGRQSVVDEEGQPLSMQPLTMDEILASLKRLRKSVDLWTKQAGTQGYLKYIRNFIP